MVRVPKKWLLRFVKHVEIRSGIANEKPITVPLDDFKKYIAQHKTPPGGFKTDIGRESGINYFEYGSNGAKQFHMTVGVAVEDSMGRCIKYFHVRNY